MSSETALSHSLQILHSNFYRLFIIMPQQFHVSIAKTNISIQHAKSEKVLFWKDSNFSYKYNPHASHPRTPPYKKASTAAQISFSASVSLPVACQI